MVSFVLFSLRETSQEKNINEKTQRIQFLENFNKN